MCNVLKYFNALSVKLKKKKSFLPSFLLLHKLSYKQRDGVLFVQIRDFVLSTMHKYINFHEKIIP